MKKTFATILPLFFLFVITFAQDLDSTKTNTVKQNVLVRPDSAFLHKLEHDARIVIAASKSKTISASDKMVVELMNTATHAGKWDEKQFSDFVNSAILQMPAHPGANEWIDQCMKSCGQKPVPPGCDKTIVACCNIYCSDILISSILLPVAAKLSITKRLIFLQH